MLSQSMDTQGVLEAAFLDELSKIAEAQGDEDSPWITKKKLKRLAVVVPAAAAGTGLGYAAGKALRRRSGAAARRAAMTGSLRATWDKLIKYAPHAAAVVSGIGAGALAWKSKKVRDYIEGRDKKSDGRS